MNIGIIGYGYWGKNLVRNFVAQKNVTVKTVLDFDIKKLQTLKELYPNIHTTTSIDDFFNDDDINAIVIATPVSSHYELAKRGLLAGKHVLVEKPMTASYIHAQELIEIATAKDLVLMVDHTFLYTSAVEKIKEIIDSGELGEIKYIDSTRINLGLFQSDVNVLWDLAAHDISICLYLLNEYPISVQATGISHTNNGIENIAYLTLKYASNKICHFNCSWTSPVKVRQMLIGGDKKMIVWNDLETTEKIRVYDYTEKTNEIEYNTILQDYRISDLYVPKLLMKEALTSVVIDFIKSIQTNKTPKSSSRIGIEVVEILEKAYFSIKNKSIEISL